MAVLRKQCLFVALLWACGCVDVSHGVKTNNAPAPQTKCAGNCLELNAKAAVDVPAFSAKVQEHLRVERYASLDAMLQRRLEVAIEALRRHDVDRAPSDVDLVLARAVDARLRHPDGDGWEAYLQGRGDGVRHAEKALAKGERFVREEKWNRACDDLEGNERAFAAYPYHAIQAGLLLSESQRRLGRGADAARSWLRAVSSATQLAGRWPAPGLWEQLSAQRTLTTPWPAEVATTLTPLLPGQLRDLPKNPAFPAEALVWFAIGNARLERSEAAAALTDFKHADSHGRFADWDDFLCLYQAKALLAMGQAPSAASVLTGLVARAGSPWQRPALAILGSGKLQDGQAQQALVFLKQAVGASRDDFLFRSEAEADLGLAYLSVEDDVNGTSRLRSAQERFQSEGRVEMLLTSLDNEAEYQERAHRTEAAQQLRTRCHDLQLAAAPALSGVQPTGHLDNADPSRR
jgi:tetratricopeptide (TPR) repeat protein